MTTDEFGVWFLEHSAAFPSLLSWFDNLGKKSPGLGDKTMAVWRQALADVPLDLARVATTRLVRGDEELPGLYDETPLKIRKIANSARYPATIGAGRYSGAHYTPNCARCNDRGLTSIWQPQLCRLLAENFPEPDPLDSVAITRSEFWKALAGNIPYLNHPVALYCSCNLGAELREAQAYANERTGRKTYKMRQATERDAYYDGSRDLNDARERGRKLLARVQQQHDF